MITKNDIDNYFTNHYDELNTYTIKALKKLKKSYDIDGLISETYLELIKKLDKLNELSDIPAFAKQYIKINILYDTAPYAKKNKILEVEPIESITDTDDIQYNIDEIVNMYYNTLKGQDKYIFELYYFKYIDTAKKIQDHLKISRTSSFNTMKDVKRIEDKFRLFVESYINNKNKLN